MYIYTAAQMKEIDSRTIQTQQISSWDLMERAARAVANKLLLHFPEDRPFVLVCGKGNNGGDGLAIARLLYHAQRNVSVYLWADSKYTRDNLKNQELLRALPVPVQALHKTSSCSLPAGTILVDCLFGYGLQHELDADWQGLIAQLNRAETVISVDLPSGLLSDAHTPATAPVVQAAYTYTFQRPKLALLMPENQHRVGTMDVLDIQLDEEVLPEGALPHFWIEKNMLQAGLLPRRPFSHKGTYGHCLIAGGSYGKIGALVLSATAALRSGCGLVSVYAPQCGYDIIQSAFPEAMVQTDLSHHCLSALPETEHYQAVALGMGMGQEPETVAALLDHLRREDTVPPPLVIDADALNILSRHPDAWAAVPEHSILTPHPKELERMLGQWSDDFEKLQRALAFATAHQVVLLIKGAYTAVVSPGNRIYFNSTGNAGMATGGSGDVLSGILAGLLAQGYPASFAALLGVWLHGHAGDLAAAELGMESLIAGDLIRYLPKAWRSLRK